MRSQAWVASLLVVFAVAGTAATAPAGDRSAEASGSWLRPAEIGVFAGYGQSTRASLDFHTFGPRLAFDLPEPIPAIAGNRLRLTVELAGSIIRDGTTEGEAAITPLLLNYRLDRGGRVVPFVEGGEGIVLTTLDGLELGGEFQFSSRIGAGVHLFLTRTDALTIGGRFRHISNAGIRDENRGLNTWLVTLGWSRFPRRP